MPIRNKGTIIQPPIPMTCANFLNKKMIIKYGIQTTKIAINIPMQPVSSTPKCSAAQSLVTT